jgi:hypothetical protein
MRAGRESAAHAIINITRIGCAAGVFDIRTFDDRYATDINVTHQCPLKVRCVDSESRFLAMEKFSCSPASYLIAARQNRFFGKIAAADSGASFPHARHRRLW